jgi:hypothetical protein
MTAYGLPSMRTGCRCFVCGRPAVRVVARSAGRLHVCGPDTTAAELAGLESDHGA